MDYRRFFTEAADPVEERQGPLSSSLQDARRGLPEPKDLLISLTQIRFERASISGVPSRDSIRALLQQHDPSDVRRIVAVLLFAIKAITYSPQWYIHRFNKMHSAASRIRCAWTSSRLRFIVKMARLVVRWNRMEAAAARVNGPQRSVEKSAHAATTQSGPRTADKRRQDAEETWARQYLKVVAPAPLKKKVFAVQYRRVMAELRYRYRKYLERARAYRRRVREFDNLPADRRRQMMAAEPPLGAEPTLDWFQMLSSLTHQQLFELSLRVQTSAINDDAGPIGSSYANPVDEYCAGRKLGAESFGLDIDAIDAYAKSDEAKEWDKMRRRNANPFDYVASRIFDHSEEMLLPTRNTTTERGEKAAYSCVKGGGVKITGLAELRSMRTLARFKGDPWFMPPRPVKALRETSFQSRCDPPSFAELDPFAKSLAVRGVKQAPVTKDPRVREKRATGLQAVSHELGNLKATYCSVADLLRSRKALEITLNLPPSKLVAPSRSATPSGASRPASAFAGTRSASALSRR
jgi:hypothetical protein